MRGLHFIDIIIKFKFIDCMQPPGYDSHPEGTRLRLGENRKHACVVIKGVQAEVQRSKKRHHKRGSVLRKIDRKRERKREEEGRKVTLRMIACHPSNRHDHAHPIDIQKNHLEHRIARCAGCCFCSDTKSCKVDGEAV